jgi:ADP-heptose:LPS heptosyltransferase
MHMHFSNILIIQLGDIGDVVWTTPAIHIVEAAFPEARLSLLVRAGSGCLLVPDPAVDRVYEIRHGRDDPSPAMSASEKSHRGAFHPAISDLRRWLRRRETGMAASLDLVIELRRAHFDLVIDLRGDERGAFTGFATGAPVRVAQYERNLPWWRNCLFTHPIAMPQGEERAVNAAEQSLRILRGFGIPSIPTAPRLHIAPETMAAVRAQVRSCGLDANQRQDWITLNPFSRWSYKEWGPEKWAQIIDWLGKEFGVTTVIVGAPAERERVEGLIRACAGPVCNLAGKTTLAELAGLLHLSRLHIGVDSAAPHIAAAVGTPTATLYGPSDWRYWAPPGEQHRIAVSDMECVPCNRKGCDGRGVSRCLDTLAVGRVQAVLRESLSA